MPTLASRPASGLGTCSSDLGRSLKVCELLEAAEEDLIAFYTFPREHWTKIRSTNPLERVVRHEAPCERRERTNNSHPCRLEYRPWADAAAWRSWGQSRRGIARWRRKRPDNVAAGRHYQTPACALARPKGRAKAKRWSKPLERSERP